jgi:hypothetical protein
MIACWVFSEPHSILQNIAVCTIIIAKTVHIAMEEVCLRMFKSFDTAFDAGDDGWWWFMAPIDGST